MFFKDLYKNTKLFVGKTYNNPKEVIDDVNIIIKNANIVDNTKNKLNDIHNVIQNANIVDNTKNKLNDIHNTIQNTGVIDNTKNIIETTKNNVIQNTEIIKNTTNPYNYFKSNVTNYICKSQYGLWILCCKIMVFGIAIIICANFCKKYITKDLNTFNEYFTKFGQMFMSLSLLMMLVLGFFRIVL